MNILLVGEFSSVHNNLKAGLIELGHKVILMSDGDGWKNYNSDISLFRYPKKGIINYLRNALHFFNSIRKVKKVDVIQFINPMILPLYVIVYFKFRKLFTKNKYVYYACGTDPAFLNSRDEFDYFPFDEKNSSETPKYHFIRLLAYRLFITYQDAIVPAMYTYFVGYRDNDKCLEPIPLPGSGDYTEDKVINKPLKILFGISRREFKGAKHILKALDKLNSSKEFNAEVSIVEKVPFKEYEKLVSEYDILIDQCKSYDYGMNAISALEKGLIVFSGSEYLAMKYIGAYKSPVINIIKDSELIIKRINEIVNLSEDALNEISSNSLYHARKFHNPLCIAKKFVNEIYNQ